MAKKSWIIPTILLLVIGGVYLTRQFARVSVGGNTTMIHKFTLQGLELRTFLTIINESRITLNVQNFLGQIFYQGTPLGVVTLIRPAQLAPFQTGQIEFRTQLSFGALATTFGPTVLKLFQNEDGTLKNSIDISQFTIKGTLQAQGFDVPINEKLLV